LLTTSEEERPRIDHHFQMEGTDLEKTRKRRKMATLARKRNNLECKKGIKVIGVTGEDLGEMIGVTYRRGFGRTL